VNNKWCDIEVSKLIEADWNYKTDDSALNEHKMSKLENNIKKNGIIENIIVRELSNNKFEVVNGNHRLKILVKLNIKVVKCYNLGKVSLNEAKRIAIETNETKFEANPIRLAEIFDDILGEFDDLTETTFFDESDIERFTNIVNPNEFIEDNSSDSSVSESTNEKEEEFKTIKWRLPVDVAQQVEDQVKRFKKILYPDEKHENVSYILPVEAMIQTLHQIDDNNIM